MNQWGTARGGLAFDPARRALDTELLALFLKRHVPDRPPPHQPQIRWIPGLLAPELLGYRVVRQ